MLLAASRILASPINASASSVGAQHVVPLRGHFQRADYRSAHIMPCAREAKIVRFPQDVSQRIIRSLAHAHTPYRQGKFAARLMLREVRDHLRYRTPQNFLVEFGQLARDHDFAIAEARLACF